MLLLYSFIFFFPIYTEYIASVTTAFKSYHFFSRTYRRKHPRTLSTMQGGNSIETARSRSDLVHFSPFFYHQGILLLSWEKSALFAPLLSNFVQNILPRKVFSKISLWSRSSRIEPARKSSLDTSATYFSTHSCSSFILQRLFGNRWPLLNRI